MRWLLFRLRYTWRYLGYYWRARTCYDVHSPFVSALLAATLEDKRWFYAFENIAYLRQQLQRDRRVIEMTDYGAGSFVSRSSHRKVSHLVRHSAVSPGAGQLLFRLALFLQPATILELGTSLGISALYLGSADRRARMLTLEGSPQPAGIAATILKEASIKAAEVRIGPFSETLQPALKDLGKVDFFHLDGDHRRSATLDYFEQCLEYAHEESVFCFSDIYWSKEMMTAWEELKQHPRVTLSIDLFHYGLLFFRPQIREKQHFTLIASRCKPWRLGFWS